MPQYEGERVIDSESGAIGVRVVSNEIGSEGVVTLVVKTSTCEGFVLVSDVSGINSYSQLESLYNNGAIVSQLELPIDYLAKNYTDKYFVSKIGDEYKLVHYKYGVSSPELFNETQGTILIFEYKEKLID